MSLTIYESNIFFWREIGKDEIRFRWAHIIWYCLTWTDLNFNLFSITKELNGHLVVMQNYGRTETKSGESEFWRWWFRFMGLGISSNLLIFTKFTTISKLCIVQLYVVGMFYKLYIIFKIMILPWFNKFFQYIHKFLMIVKFMKTFSVRSVAR